MTGRELEALLVKVLQESGHPRIASVETFDALHGSDNLGVHVKDTDQSEGWCQIFAVSKNGKRLNPDDNKIPEELR